MIVEIFAKRSLFICTIIHDIVIDSFLSAHEKYHADKQSSYC